MQEFIEAHEAAIRLGFFLGVFAVMAGWEIAAPRRALTVSKAVRWVNNLGLVTLNTLLLRLMFPAAAGGMAAVAAEQGWGLLNHFHVPFWPAVALSLIAMDFVIWVQHADLDCDVTTGARFHPIEIILSMLIKFATVLLLGPPVVAVILFEVILNGMAMFNHGNVRLPGAVDRVLRTLLVTPDMHRVHHSVEDDEANSNFGFNLSLWDRLFDTYRAQPRQGHESMTIGIHHYRKPGEISWLSGLLTLPFMAHIGGYAINGRRWSAGDE